MNRLRTLLFIPALVFQFSLIIPMVNRGSFRLTDYGTKPLQKISRDSSMNISQASRDFHVTDAASLPQSNDRTDVKGGATTSYDCPTEITTKKKIDTRSKFFSGHNRSGKKGAAISEIGGSKAELF